MYKYVVGPMKEWDALARDGRKLPSGATTYDDYRVALMHLGMDGFPAGSIPWRGKMVRGAVYAVKWVEGGVLSGEDGCGRTVEPLDLYFVNNAGVPLAVGKRK